MNSTIKLQWWEITLHNLEKYFTQLNLPEKAIKMVKYQLNTGGKKIRPQLAIWVQEAYQQPLEDIIDFAAGVEIFHNASLIHDDIQDKDTIRRGKPAAWTIFSEEQGINLGDLLFTLAFEMFNKSNLPDDIKLKLILLSNTCLRKVIEGQILEFEIKQLNRWDEKFWLEIVKRKTGSLFILPLRGAGIIAKAPSDEIDMLEDLGLQLGTLFQLRDDIIDFIGSKEGREAGGDIKEGKPTLLASIYFAQEKNQSSASKIRQILTKPKEKTSPQEVEEVIKRYHQQKCLELAQKKYLNLESNLKKSDIIKRNSNLAIKIDSILESLTIGL